MQKSRAIFVSASRYAALGLGSAFFLSLIELIDTNIQLAPVFRSFSERLAFATYFSMNLFGGMMIGLLSGLFALSASPLKRTLQKAMVSAKTPLLLAKAAAGLVVCAVAGITMSR